MFMKFMQGLGVLREEHDDMPEGVFDEDAPPDFDDDEEGDEESDPEPEPAPKKKGQSDDDEPLSYEARRIIELESKLDSLAARLTSDPAPSKKEEEPDEDEKLRTEALKKIGGATKENFLDVLEEIGPATMAKLLQPRSAAISREDVERMVSARLEAAEEDRAFQTEYPEFAPVFAAGMDLKALTALGKREPHIKEFLANIKQVTEDGVTGRMAALRMAARLTRKGNGKWGGTRQTSTAGVEADVDGSSTAMTSRDLRFIKGMGINPNAIRASMQGGPGLRGTQRAVSKFEKKKGAR